MPLRSSGKFAINLFGNDRKHMLDTVVERVQHSGNCGDLNNIWLCVLHSITKWRVGSQELLNLVNFKLN